MAKIRLHTLTANVTTCSFCPSNILSVRIPRWAKSKIKADNKQCMTSKLHPEVEPAVRGSPAALKHKPQTVWRKWSFRKRSESAQTSWNHQSCQLPSNNGTHTSNILCSYTRFCATSIKAALRYLQTFRFTAALRLMLTARSGAKALWRSPAGDGMEAMKGWRQGGGVKED